MTEQPTLCHDGLAHRWLPVVGQQVKRDQPIRWACARCGREAVA